MNFQDALLASTEKDRESLVRTELEQCEWDDLVYSLDGNHDSGSVENAISKLNKIKNQEEGMVVSVQVDWEEHEYSGCPDMPRIKSRQTKIEIHVLSDGSVFELVPEYVDIGGYDGNDYY
jgi:hypothetical protein